MAGRVKKKFENILYYHKSKILAGAAAAALLIWGACLFGGGSPDTALYGEAVNVEISRESADAACRAGIAALGKNPDREQIILETGMEIDVESPEANAGNGNLEKMTTSIFAREIDFIICTPAVMDYYAEKDALEKLGGGYGMDITDRFPAKDGGKTMFCIFKNSEHKEDARLFGESLVQFDREE